MQLDAIVAKSTVAPPGLGRTVSADVLTELLTSSSPHSTLVH